MSPNSILPYPRRAAFLLLSALLVLLSAGTARAQLTEPTGNTIPVPVAAAETSLVMSRGFPATAVTLPGLFGYRNETIDYIKDARTTPGAFSPLCSFTGQMMIRGGGCQLDFAWYNATDPPTKPAASDLHVLIPATAYTDPNGYACMSVQDFCPLATHMTTQPNIRWVDKVYSSDTIRTNPAYKGGLIGFAIVGGSMQCTETHYSQMELNTANEVNSKPWITALMWKSIASPDSYYIGFEDWPMTAQNWANNPPANDGDFNDFVFFLSGLTCKGGGQPCTVAGAQGPCSVGVTDCDATGTTTVCRSVFKSAPEKCDNIDNDCNGTVDDGDPHLDCPESKFCTQGLCQSACTAGSCQSPLTCDTNTGRCTDASCNGVSCTAGQLCSAGKCVGACDGVVCPLGQTCETGSCIDLCAGVTCPAGNVCEQGACVQACGCRTCPTGMTCNTTSGICVATGCEKTTCPAGQGCQAGKCVDTCTGAKCPGGTMCSMGVCPPPGAIIVSATTGGTGTTDTTDTTGSTTGTVSTDTGTGTTTSTSGSGGTNGGTASTTGVTGTTGGTTGATGITGGTVTTAGATGITGASTAGNTNGSTNGTNGGTTASTSGGVGSVNNPRAAEPAGCSCRIADAGRTESRGAAGAAALVALSFLTRRTRRARSRWRVARQRHDKLSKGAAS